MPPLCNIRLVESSVDVSAVQKLALDRRYAKADHSEQKTKHHNPQVPGSVPGFHTQMCNNASHYNISLLGWQLEPSLRGCDINNHA